MTKETGSINRSLFTLGKVIAILSRGETFVPYRDSKLTKLLMDSLGGSSSCVMVACCSPSGRFVDETLSTLQYASKAKNICNKPILQLDPSQRLIQQLRTEIQGLRAENMQLRMQQGIPAGEKILTSSMAMLRVQQEEEAAKEAGRRREVQSNPGSPGGEDTFSRASSLSHRSSKMLNGTGGGDLLYEKVMDRPCLFSSTSSTTTTTSSSSSSSSSSPTTTSSSSSRSFRLWDTQRGTQPGWIRRERSCRGDSEITETLAHPMTAALSTSTTHSLLMVQHPPPPRSLLP
eukprot:768117-Hanusia_phi.AAC.1